MDSDPDDTDGLVEDEPEVGPEEDGEPTEADSNHMGRPTPPHAQ